MQVNKSSLRNSHKKFKIKSCNFLFDYYNFKFNIFKFNIFTLIFFFAYISFYLFCFPKNFAFFERNSKIFKNFSLNILRKYFEIIIFLTGK